MSAPHRIAQAHRRPANPAEPTECGAVMWRVGSVEEVPVGEGRTFVVGEELVAVFRLRGGGVRAVAAVCPHLGGPLADGLIDGQQVICPLHNHAFRLADGQCTTGELAVQAYRVSVDNGELVIHL